MGTEGKCLYPNAALIEDDRESVNKTGKLLSDFGTGISEFIIADVSIEKVNLVNDLRIKENLDIHSSI